MSYRRNNDSSVALKELLKPLQNMHKLNDNWLIFLDTEKMLYDMAGAISSAMLKYGISKNATIYEHAKTNIITENEFNNVTDPVKITKLNKYKLLYTKSNYNNNGAVANIINLYVSCDGAIMIHNIYSKYNNQNNQKDSIESIIKFVTTSQKDAELLKQQYVL